jgi:hypothetical protein
MEENKKQLTDVIDLGALIKKVLGKKRLFYYKVWPITFVVSCIYILGLPRYYTSDAKLAPEIGGNSMSSGTLGSIASSLGFDLSEMQTSDAITPLLYPDLMEDNGFVTGLFNIKVVSQDGEINTTYYNYLKKHQKRSIWTYPMSWLKSLLPKSESKGGGSSEFNPYYLSKGDDDVASAIRGNIQFSIDKKTGVISISTKAQDALICKTLADSVSVHLQDFITEYRTNKARIDYEYYKELASKAKQDYEKVRRQYASMADANTNVSLRSVELKMEDLENDMQLKYNAYTQMYEQLQISKAKVQESTPAFTVVQSASVPLKHSNKSKLMMMTLFMFLGALLRLLILTKNHLKEVFIIV